MGVQCPKHRAGLAIEYTSINLLGNRYPVVTGQCPVCKVKYLSREILSSSGSFKLDGQLYEYLNELEMAYPHPFKPITHLKKTTPAKEEEKEEKSDPFPDESVRSEPVKRNPSKKKTDQAAKKAEEKQTKKDTELAALRQRLASNKGKVLHVHKLFYPSVMPQTCPRDGETLFYVARVMIDMAGAGIQTKAWCCLKCKTAYIQEEDQTVIREKIRQASLQENVAGGIIVPKTPEAPDETGFVNLAIPQSTLYVCKGLITCNRNGHAVESATGVLLGKNGIAIKINTNYCPQCGKYFISYAEYEHYRQLYGVLLGNIKITNGSFTQSEITLAEESILHICGYSVNQASDLSSSERQGILQYLIDSKVSSKHEIIEYLNFFIRRNGKRSNMEEAVRRWNDDLRWVREYQINRQRHFEIANIHRIR